MHFKNKNFWIGVFIFILALLMRGMYLCESSGNPTFNFPIVDSLAYDQMARDLISGQPLTYEFFWQPIFYPVFLSICYSISDSSILFTKIIQILIGSLTAVLVYNFSYKIFGKPAGIISGIITAIYMPLIFFESELLATGWAAFWSIAIVFMFFITKQKFKLSTTFLLGLCGGLAIITRPVFLPFFILALIWLLISVVIEKVKPTTILAGFSCTILGLGLVIAPVLIVSSDVLSKPSLMPLSGGINLYIGNNPNYHETINIRPGNKWKQLTELPSRHGQASTHHQAQEFFKKKTIDYIKESPLSFINGIFYKTTVFLNSREMPRNLDIYLFRQWSSMLSAGLFKISNTGFPFIILLPLSVIGIIFNFRKIPMPLWLYIIFYPAAVILVFVAARYRMPIIPIMSVLAGGGIISISQAIKSRPRQLVLMSVVSIFVCVLAILPGPFHEEQLNYEAELYYGIGDSLHQHNETDSAIEAYSKAIKSRGDHIEAHQNIGYLFAGKKQFELAFKHYFTALDLEPENIKLLHNIAHAFVQTGELSNALKYYLKVIELSPNESVVYNIAGRILAKQNQPEKAIKYFNRSLQIQPDNISTINNLANAMLVSGQIDEAIEKYRYALALSPDDPGVHFNLGISLIKKGLVKQAIKEFKTVLSIEPDHQKAAQILKELQK